MRFQRALSAGLVAGLTVFLVTLFCNGAAAQDQDQVLDQPAVPVMTLTPADVESFIAATSELGPVGQRAGAAILGGSADPTQTQDAIIYGVEALAVLQRHGFDPARFQQVGYAVALAMAASELGLTPDTLDGARAALSGMRPYVSAEQYVLLEERLDTALRLYRSQPPSNISLVSEYRGPLLALLSP